MRAVIDRIEDGKHAVLLVEENEERVIDVTELPPGATDGTWLSVEFDGNELISIEVDYKRTATMKEVVAQRMMQLRKRGRRS